MFEVKPDTLLASGHALSRFPGYLLAAIVGIAEPYRRYDPVLCMSHVNFDFPITEVWEVVHQGISDELQRPGLHLIQAILIYIQRDLRNKNSPATDNPGNWPLLGVVANLATQLGLHIDCTKWPILPHQKRLRRRLWWVVHSEISWRSLLLGRPIHLHEDDCNVPPLEAADFASLLNRSGETSRHAPTIPGPCPYCHLGHDFLFLSKLSHIASKVYRSFYTIAASLRLSTDFDATLRIANDLLHELDTWKLGLPQALHPESRTDVNSRPYFHSASGAHLKLAALTLEVLIYRAIWRCTNGKAPLTDCLACPNSATALFTTNTSMMRNSSSISAPPANGSHASETNGAFDNQPSEQPIEGSCEGIASIKDMSSVIHNSLRLARRVLEFTQGLDSYDRNSFAFFCKSLSTCHRCVPL